MHRMRQARVIVSVIARSLRVCGLGQGGDLPGLNRQLTADRGHLAAQDIHVRPVGLQQDLTVQLLDLRLHHDVDLAVIQQPPDGAVPGVHGIDAVDADPVEVLLDVAPRVVFQFAPRGVGFRFDPDIADHEVLVARFRRAVVDVAVAQPGDPAFQAADGLGDGAAACPVADGRLNVGVAAQIHHVQRLDRGAAGKQFADIQRAGGNFIHQRVGRVDVGGAQILGHDVRAEIDGFPVAGVPVFDFLLGHRHLGGRHCARRRYVQLIEVIVRCLDHQVADGRGNNLGV